MAFEDPTYEIECRAKLKERINGHKLHPSTKSLIAMHPSIVLNYMDQYGDRIAINGINNAYREYDPPSLQDMRLSIESLME